ncbi:MAG: Fic family protein [Acidobacteria bacterium]|nr:Fic family protein [Acidobacteriota bacterium]
MVFACPPLSDAERSVIATIDELRTNLSYAAGSRRWTGLLRRVAFARAIQGSNSIEGYNVTVDDALAAVDGEPPLDAVAETWAAIVGYRNAMTYVLQLADDEHFEYSASLIKALHYTMLSYDLAKRPGRWRAGAIFVRSEPSGERVYEGPDVELVPGLIDELAASLNAASDVPALVRAAMAHLNLVMIHPYADGNGRMARCLQSLVLAREGILAPQFCSIEEYLGRNTQAYYAVLAQVGAGAWHPERDTLPWVRFCLTAHYRQAQTLLRRTREIQRLWDALEALIKERGLPERTLAALSDTAMGFRLTNSRYRALADVSPNLASRDLATLCAAGLLTARGERRGRHYIASWQTRGIYASAREARVHVPDPFGDSGAAARG